MYGQDLKVRVEEDQKKRQEQAYYNRAQNLARQNGGSRVSSKTSTGSSNGSSGSNSNSRDSSPARQAVQQHLYSYSYSSRPVFPRTPPYSPPGGNTPVNGSPPESENSDGGEVTPGSQTPTGGEQE